MKKQKTVEELLEKYNAEIASLKRKCGKLKRATEELCSHTAIFSYEPEPNIGRDVIESLASCDSGDVFMVSEYRICRNCGKEERIYYPGTVVRNIREEKRRRFSGLYVPLQKITLEHFLRLREEFSINHFPKT